MKFNVPALLLLVATGVSAFAVPPLIRNPYSIDVNGSLEGTVKGNFGGDSAEDVLIIWSGLAIQTYINVDDGPFSAMVETPLSHVVVPAAAAAGHFDADGLLDLAVGELDLSAKVAIYHGNGDGTFRRGEVVDTPTFPSSLTAADFNGDGKSDVAVASAEASGVTVHLGMGSGVLSAAIVTALSDTPEHLVAGDFNGDGKADLVLSDVETTTVALSLGNGQFNATFTRSGGNGAVAGHFDGDTKLDLFAAADHLGTFHLHRGNGNGTFAAPASHHLVRDPTVKKLQAIDIDGNGHLDVLGGDSRRGLGVLRGNGDATFDAPEYWITDDVAQLFTGDFDRDGNVDVLYRAGLIQHGPLLLLRGTSGGAFEGYRAVEASSPSVQTRVVVRTAAADMNGDGKPDLVAVTGRDDRFMKELVVYLNDGAGNWSAPIVTAFDPEIYPGPPVFGDVNGDGKIDAVVGDFTHLGNGNGTFQAPIHVASLGSGRTFLVDVDGDGDLDLLNAFSDQHYHTDIHRGTGSGTFSGISSLQMRVDSVADFNGDGRPDVAGRSYQHNATRVGLNDGSGGFVLHDADPAEFISDVPAAADFNGDGHADLVMAHADQGIRVAFGRGNGTFGDAVYLKTDVSLWNCRCSTADVDGDGALDLVADRGRILLGDGAGRFRSYAQVRGAQGASAIADFDSDGDLDLAVASGGLVALVHTKLGPDPALTPVLTLGATPAAPRYGAEVTFNASLSMPNTHASGGAFLVTKDGVPVWLRTLDEATWLTHRTPFTTGTHSLTVAFTGDTHHAPVAQTVVLDIPRAATEVGGPIRPRACAAEVLIEVGLDTSVFEPEMAAPTGELVFRIGNTVLPSRPSTELWGYYVSGLSIGTHTITADYAGDANFEPSTATFTQVITAPYSASITAGSAVYRNESGNLASIAGAPSDITATWTIANGTIESGQGTARIVYTAGASGQVTLQATIAQNGTACSMAANADVPIIERLPGASMLYTLAPCRLVDTRGGAPLGGAADAELPIAGQCGIPAGAKSVVANVTVIAPAQSGWMSLWPADQPWPGTSNINYREGKTRANNAIVPLSPDGRIRLRNSGTGVHYLIDVYGYFR
jgi:hypothetical protein